MDIGGAGIALQGIGALSSAVGSYYAAQSQISSLRFASDMADINAKVAESAAQMELINGDKQVGQTTLQYGQLKSSQRAAMAANGVDLGEGSAAEVQASTDLFKEIDKNQIVVNATQAAWGRRMDAANYRSNAIMNRGTASGINPAASSFNTLLTGATKVAASWYEYSKTK